MRRVNNKHLYSGGRLLDGVLPGLLAGVIDDGSNVHVLPAVTRCQESRHLLL